MGQQSEDQFNQRDQEQHGIIGVCIPLALSPKVACGTPLSNVPFGSGEVRSRLGHLTM